MSRRYISSPIGACMALAEQLYFPWWRDKLWNSTLRGFLQHPLTSSIMGPIIVLSTMFSDNLSMRSCRVAVSWRRRLVACHLPRRSGFVPGSVCMGFVADKVALGQVLLRILRFSPVSIVPPWLSMLIPGRWTINPFSGRSSEAPSHPIDIKIMVLP
jgi:hypothetical protein